MDFPSVLGFFFHLYTKIRAPKGATSASHVIEKNIGHRSRHERSAACRGVPTDPPSPAPPGRLLAGLPRPLVVAASRRGRRGRRRSTEGRGPRGRDSSRPQTASPSPVAGRRLPPGHGGPTLARAPWPAPRRAAPDAGCRRVTERKEGPRHAAPPASAVGRRRSTEGRGPLGRDSSRPQTASPAPVAGRRLAAKERGRVSRQPTE